MCEATSSDLYEVPGGGFGEYAVDDLVRSGAPIDVYAVGTRAGVSADAPYVDSAYKLVEYDGRPVMKLSSAKVTAPGPKQVFRRPGCAEVIGLADEQPPDEGRPAGDGRCGRGGAPAGGPRWTSAGNDWPPTWWSCHPRPAVSGLPSRPERRPLERDETETDHIGSASS
jgi:nicotinate phosphoribosyltransferase